MFFDYDPELQIREDIFFDQDGKDVMRSVQDCTDSIEYNRFMAEGLNKKQDWWHVSNIPLSLCLEWAQESKTRMFSREWQVYVKKKVMDPDFRKLNPNGIRF